MMALVLSEIPSFSCSPFMAVEALEGYGMDSMLFWRIVCHHNLTGEDV